MQEAGNGDWAFRHSCNSMLFGAKHCCCCCGTQGQTSAWIGWNRLETKSRRCGPDCHSMDIVGLIVPLVAKTCGHCWALWSHATPGHGHWFHHLMWRGDLCWDSNLGELWCSPALMAGMFGHSNQNNWASVALPFVRNGDGPMPPRRSTCCLSICMSTELSMA